MNIRISLIAMAVCLTDVAIAQGAPAIQSSAGITNLHFEYSDIRPDDGIAASLAIKSAQSISGFVTGGPSTATTSAGFSESSSVGSRGHLLDNRAFDVALVNNEATFVKQAGSIVANLAVQASTFGKSTYDTTTTLGLGEQTAGGGAFASRFDDGRGIALTLGAGTELKISGSLFSSLSLNTDSVIGLTKGHELLVSANNDVSVSLGPSWETYWTEDLRDVLGGGRYPSERIYQSVQRTVSPLGSGPDSAASASDSRTFEFVARNTRDTAVTIYLNASLSTSGEWRSANAAPVPEPSTWAMLLAGLGLTGIFARRRQGA